MTLEKYVGWKFLIKTWTDHEKIFTIIFYYSASQPSDDTEKDIAMKINRAVAVPVGALTQRSGQDLKNQIAKISSLFDCKGNR